MWEFRNKFQAILDQHHTHVKYDVMLQVRPNLFEVRPI